MSLSLRREVTETIDELMDELGNGTVTTLIVATLAFSAGAFLSTCASGPVQERSRSRAHADLVELQATVGVLNDSFAQLQERVSNLEKRQAARRRSTPTARRSTRSQVTG
ncbi:hypothetical protein MUP00_03860 [Candidatus Bathyarchaeota archaeon]|nr:hypothetical protein [Candidatus Bathyarchaeota archaeon]